MATCNYIPETRQNPSAMHEVIVYVSKPEKTVDENGRQYLVGQNCTAAFAEREFLSTKKLWKKTDGVWFYHYVQSFVPGEISDPAVAQRVGIELSKRFFSGCEVLIATHLDAKDDEGRVRYHNHFVVNSVLPDSGKKAHFDRRSIEQMRKISDELCISEGLSVMKSFVQTENSASIGTREYRATIKGEGWKFALINDIEAAMKTAITQEQFLSLMAKVGYTAVWLDTHKYLTWTCPNGKKVRDIKLHETKFLKENMENEFRIRKQLFGAEPDWDECDRKTQSGVENGCLSCDEHAVSADSLRSSERVLRSGYVISERSGAVSADALREDLGALDKRGRTGGCGPALPCAREMVGAVCGHGDEVDRKDNSGGEGSAQRLQKGDRTGWENEREVLIRSYLEGGEASASVYGRSDGGETLAFPTDDRDGRFVGGDFCTYERSSVSLDALIACVLETGQLPEKTPETEALSRLYFAAKEERNRKAYNALCRLLENPRYAILTDVSYLVADLALLFPENETEGEFSDENKWDGESERKERREHELSM